MPSETMSRFIGTRIFALRGFAGPLFLILPAVMCLARRIQGRVGAGVERVAEG
jgi:hypothetical protein